MKEEFSKWELIILGVYGLTILVLTLTYDTAFQYQDLVDESFYFTMNTMYHFGLWGFFCLGLVMIFHMFSVYVERYENIFGGMMYVGLFGSFGILIATFNQVTIFMKAIEMVQVMLNGALVLLFMCIVFGIPIGFAIDYNDKNKIKKPCP